VQPHGHRSLIFPLARGSCTDCPFLPSFRGRSPPSPAAPCFADCDTRRRGLPWFILRFEFGRGTVSFVKRLPKTARGPGVFFLASSPVPFFFCYIFFWVNQYLARVDSGGRPAPSFFPSSNFWAALRSVGIPPSPPWHHPRSPGCAWVDWFFAPFFFLQSIASSFFL